MIHYFLGLVVWQRIDEIFPSQGKYTVDKLKKFELLNLKCMATAMVTNMKKICVSSSYTNKIDLTPYR
jgi:hypothetical protein